MRVWHSSSSESKPCLVCGKKTAHYKIYEQSNICVRVPLCDSMDRPNCYSEFDIKRMAARFLTDVKKTVRVEV